MTRPRATVGVSDHAGWAALMTVGADGTVFDRRRVELVDPALPSFAYHHGAQGLPIDEGVELVERVAASAAEHAARGLAALAEAVPADIVAIALRVRPALPPTIAERIQSYHAQTRADGVMYREALAAAAEARGWGVRWFDPKRVFDEAARSLGVDSLDPLFDRTRAALGPPWRKDQKLAMAAALAGRQPGPIGA
ncbi:MAG: hypothetical protein EVA89_08995 [Sandaracinaceae bacterium]|nr:MAG: hypothetical protein EVA89_08995 [Sandaracinaceae bacterium]